MDPQLVELGRRYTAMAGALVDRPMDLVLAHEAQGITADYCREVKALWGIELEPRITMSPTMGYCELNADPKTDWDRIRWERLQESDPDRLL